jgi:hypothetical protein
MKAKVLADREHLLKAARVLPTPKGSVTNILVPGAKEAEQLTEGDSGESDLPGMADVLKNLQSDIAPPKQLPPPVADAEVVDE